MGAPWRRPRTRGVFIGILNSSKGLAVRATMRAGGRVLYKAAIRRRLENQPDLWLGQQAVDDLMVEGDRGGQQMKARKSGSGPARWC